MHKRKCTFVADTESAPDGLSRRQTGMTGAGALWSYSSPCLCLGICDNDLFHSRVQDGFQLK